MRIRFGGEEARISGHKPVARENPSQRIMHMPVSSMHKGKSKCVHGAYIPAEREKEVHAHACRKRSSKRARTYQY